MDILRNMQNLTGNVPAFFANATNNLVQNRTPWENPNAADKVLAPIKGVPDIYMHSVHQAAAHTGYAPEMIAHHLASENGGKWDPNLTGRRDPNDRGIPQLNPIAIATITGKNGGINYFKENYGREYNPTSGNDQILAAGVYLNWLKQKALPAAGVNNPTPEAVFTAYNTGAQGYANNPDSARARRYQDLLATHQLTF